MDDEQKWNRQTNDPQDNKNSDYGKRPLWQWIAIYLIGAVIVYGFFYYLFFNRGSLGY